MKNVSEHGGLSARQKATDKVITMIRFLCGRLKRGVLLVSISAALLALSSCDERAKGQSSQNVGKNHTASDTVAQPRVSIQVNRRYDDKGNLIGFDSTYASFYSNVKGDTVRMDSLMHSFNRYFDLNHSGFLDRQFYPLFFDDSLRYPDFFNRDFFMKRYELNDDYLRGTMRRMDSIKNHFFREHSKQWKDPKDL